MKNNKIMNAENIKWKMFYPDRSLWELEKTPIALAMSEEKTTVNAEMIIKRSDNTQCLVLCNSAPIYNSDGKVIGGIITYPDITELKEIEKQFIISEHKYKRLFESSRDALMILDENGFIDCNSAALKIFGCSKKDDFIALDKIAKN